LAWGLLLPFAILDGLGQCGKGSVIPVYVGTTAEPPDQAALGRREIVLQHVRQDRQILRPVFGNVHQGLDYGAIMLGPESVSVRLALDLLPLALGGVGVNHIQNLCQQIGLLFCRVKGLVIGVVVGKFPAINGEHDIDTKQVRLLGVAQFAVILSLEDRTVSMPITL